MAIDWGRSSQEIIRTAPVVSEQVAHGRKSIQFNPRNRLRKVQVNWAGYARTVEAMLRTQWHVSGIARASETLDDPEERLRHSPLTDPRAWPAYGALLIDAQRMVSELLTTREGAAVPTENTPVRGRIQWRAES